MTDFEAKQANAIHAIWDVIVMHHSIESAANTHEVPVYALHDVARTVMAKVKEYEYYERLKGGKKPWHGDASAVKENKYCEQREIPNKRV